MLTDLILTSTCHQIIPHDQYIIYMSIACLRNLPLWCSELHLLLSWKNQSTYGFGKLTPRSSQDQCITSSRGFTRPRLYVIHKPSLFISSKGMHTKSLQDEVGFGCQQVLYSRYKYIQQSNLRSNNTTPLEYTNATKRSKTCRPKTGYIERAVWHFRSTYGE